MTVSVAPLFLVLNNKTISAVILQLEQDGKGEKDNAEKDDTGKTSLKEKKFFDEDIVANYTLLPILIDNNLLHNQEHALLVQLYHPVVPTPPPNA